MVFAQAQGTGSHLVRPTSGGHLCVSCIGLPLPKEEFCLVGHWLPTGLTCGRSPKDRPFSAEASTTHQEATPSVCKAQNTVDSMLCRASFVSLSHTQKSTQDPSLSLHQIMRLLRIYRPSRTESWSCQVKLWRMDLPMPISPLVIGQDMGMMDAWRNTINEDPLRWWRGLRAVFEQGALPSLTVFLTRLVGIRVLPGDAMFQATQIESGKHRPAAALKAYQQPFFSRGNEPGGATRGQGRGSCARVQYDQASTDRLWPIVWVPIFSGSPLDLWRHAAGRHWANGPVYRCSFSDCRLKSLSARMSKSFQYNRSTHTEVRRAWSFAS